MGNAQKGGINEVDKSLEQQRLRESLTFKVLLLGAGESGKTTTLKQLRLTTRPFEEMDKNEVRNYISALQINCLESIGALVKAAQRFSLDLSERSGPAAEHVLSALETMDASSDFNLDPALANDISALWEDPSIKKAYERRNEYWILDGCGFYMENVQTYAKKDFWPTEIDVVMARGRTTGIVVTDFEEGPLTWKVVDVGGQRSERKKWLKCFDDVKAILFVVNLAGYDSVLFEDETKNRMVEELQLIEEIAKNPTFADTPVFVFFNKKDVFEENLKRKPIKRLFPEYSGGEEDVEESMKFICHKFLEKFGNRSVQHWFVSARYKKDVKYAFTELKDAIKAANQVHIDKVMKEMKKK